MAEATKLEARAASPAGAGPARTPHADLVAQALRTVDISQLLVASGTIGSLKVDAIELGEATIDRLVIQYVSAHLRSGNAFLENVRSSGEIRQAFARVAPERLQQHLKAVKAQARATAGTATKPR